MKNREIEAAWTYHNGTKHSYESIRTNPHYLDWENQPMPFKIYPDAANRFLYRNIYRLPDAGAVGHFGAGAVADATTIPTSQTLAEILFLSAGITRRRAYPGGEMLFRAAACTGALYHIDLYVVCGDLEDLEAGVYQFSPQDFSLRQIARGRLSFRPRRLPAAKSHRS